MNNQNNQNGRGVFYGVIGVATLVVAIVGATFAYFTASETNNNVITGNAATITFGLTVERAEENDANGLIPMANTMVEPAVDGSSNSNGICKDDNGNSVCQVYRITVENTSTASMFLDGYVTLADSANGSLGVSTDVTTAPTVMRWAQVFCTDSNSDGTVETCSTGGTTTTGATVSAESTTVIPDFDEISQDKTQDSTGKNLANIYGATTDLDAVSEITTTGYIQKNSYDIINRNYIRTSYRNAGATDYVRANDGASALVFNQYLGNKDSDNKEQDIYIVVWLSETGTNQTPGDEVTRNNTTTTNGPANNFFTGTVTFLSAQGGEVSATFSGFTTVKPTDNAAGN